LDPQGGFRLEKEILIPKESIQSRVKELGAKISADYKGREPVLIGILNGVVFFFADLIRQISIPVELDFMRAASYGSEKLSSGQIRLTKDVEIPIKGRQVVVVEDIVDTGLTLTHILRLLEKKGAESVRLCALIDKREHRKVEVHVDYCGFQINEGFIVGYGLDYAEKYRYLPEIYLLK
jgi:hypoxanthine phosphoribosyltransferase